MAGSSTTTIRTFVAGVSVSSAITKEDELSQVFQHLMPAGKAGTLTTRTDNAIGVITVASGHGITTSDTVAVFWSDGSRFSVTVTATAATTITIATGAGTNLPAQGTAVVVGLETEHAFAIDGDQLSVLAIGSDNRASINFRDSLDASLLAYDLAAREGRLWIAGQGFTNPLASDVVANVVVANGGTADKTIVVGLLSNTI